MEGGGNLYDPADGYFFYKYSPIFALLMSVIRFTTVSLQGALRVWYVILFVSLIVSSFLIKEMLSGGSASRKLGFFDVAPLVILFRYLVVNSFMRSFMALTWPWPVKLIDNILLWCVLPIFILCQFLKRKEGPYETNYDIIAIGGAVFFVLRFIMLNIDRAQVNILVMLFLLFFSYYDLKKRHVLSGMYLAIAAAIKLTPAIFLIYLIAKRRYKTLFSSLISFAVLMLLPAFKIGFSRNSEMLKGWVGALGRTMPLEYLQYKNQSLMTAVSRFFSGNSDISFLKLNGGYLTGVIALTYAVFVFILIRSFAKEKVTGGDVGAQYNLSLFFVAMTMLSPVGTKATFVYLLFPLSLLIKESFARHFKDRLLNAGLLLFVSLIYLNSGDVIGDFSVLLHKYSLMTFCLVIVFALTIYAKRTPIRAVSRTP